VSQSWQCRIALTMVSSALCLRLFGVDLTAPAKKSANSKGAEDAQADEEEPDAEELASNE